MKSPWLDVIRKDVLYRYVNLAADGSLVVTGAAAADIADVNAYPVTGTFNLGVRIPSSGTAGTTGTYNDVTNVRTFTLTAGYYLF